MSAVDDLIAFLWARLDEDEARTRELLVRAQQTTLMLKDPKLLGRFIPGWHDWPDVERMCAERLAEVEAKREILDEYRLWAEDDSRDYDQSQTAADRTAALEVVVKLLAQPYAEHPDYRPEWRS